MSPATPDHASSPRAPGPASEAPDSAAATASAAEAAPWGVTLALTFACGALAGGVLVFAAGWARSERTAPEQGAEVDPRPTAAAPEIELGRDRAPLDEVEVREATPDGAPPAAGAAPAEVVDEAPPPDTSPAGLEATYGAAVVRLVTVDAEGDSRPPSPAVVVGERRVLVAYSAVEGAQAARVTDTTAGSFDVVGIVAFDRAFDLALLEVDAALPDPSLAIAPDAFATARAVLLGATGDPAGVAAEVTLASGAVARYGGGPRLEVAPAPAFAGAAIDEEGRLLAVVAAAGEDARPVAVAAEWPAFDTAPIPLDAFLRAAGPGAPASRVAEARKLLGQRRFHEAARLLLELVAAEPRLLAEVGDDLRTATLEAARAAMTAGQGPTAVLLLSEVLARRPDDGELWAARGRAHAVAGEVTAALDAFGRAIELEPARGEAWRSEARGALADEVNRLHARGLTDAAIGLLLDHRASFPGDGRLRTLAAELSLESRRFAAAAALFDEAAVLDARVAVEAREGARRARDLAGGPGAIAIDFVPGSDEVVVEGRLDDRVSGRLLVDPTQDLSIVSVTLARAAGYSLASAPRVRADFDATMGEVHVVELRSLVIAGVGTDRVRAAVVEADRPVLAGRDGVLGMSFLGRYRRVEDRALGRLVLWPR